MKKTKIIFLSIFILLAFNLYPLFVANESERGFQTGNLKTNLETPTISKFVIEGGSFYLKSYSNFLLFLNKVELSELNGLNYEEILLIANEVISDLESAKKIYLDLTQLADTTPYEPFVINQLLNFDYQALMATKNLNPTILKNVEGFLAKGDIRGVYHKLHVDVSDLTVQLYKVKAILERNEFPGVSELWNIHQCYTNSIFFGQYVANVFFEIK